MFTEIAHTLNAITKNTQENVSTWSEDDEVIIGNDESVYGAEALLALPAFINYSGSCGFASSGRTAYVVNRRRDRSVRATVRIKWRQGIDYGQRDVIKTIPAGSRMYLGCTRGNGVNYASYEYTVVGAVVL